MGKVLKVILETIALKNFFLDSNRLPLQFYKVFSTNNFYIYIQYIFINSNKYNMKCIYLTIYSIN